MLYRGFLAKMGSSLCKITINTVALGSDLLRFFFRWSGRNGRINLLWAMMRAGTKGYTSEFPWLELGEGRHNMSKSSASRSHAVVSPYPSVSPVYKPQQQQPLIDITITTTISLQHLSYLIDKISSSSSSLSPLPTHHISNWLKETVTFYHAKRLLWHFLETWNRTQAGLDVRNVLSFLLWQQMFDLKDDAY